MFSVGSADGRKTELKFVNLLSVCGTLMVNDESFIGGGDPARK